MCVNHERNVYVCVLMMYATCFSVFGWAVTAPGGTAVFFTNPYVFFLFLRLHGCSSQLDKTRQKTKMHCNFFYFAVNIGT